MEYKKYSVDDSYERAMSNLIIISNNMIKVGLIQKSEMWSKPVRVTGLVSEEGEDYIDTGLWFYENPENKEMLEFTNTFDQREINPNSEELEYFKIYQIMAESAKKSNVNWLLPPHSLDYKKDVARLYSEKKFDEKGELVGVIYYRKYDIVDGEVVFYDPYVKYEANYFYNEVGYTVKRTVNRYWMTNKGNWLGLKVTDKFYNPIESREASIRRRKNLINNLLLETVYMIFLTEGLENLGEAELVALPFFQGLGDELNFYYEVGNKSKEGEKFPMYISIAESTDSWLDNPINAEGVTIRQNILHKIDY